MTFIRSIKRIIDSFSDEASQTLTESIEDATISYSGGGCRYYSNL